MVSMFCIQCFGQVNLDFVRWVLHKILLADLFFKEERILILIGALNIGSVAGVLCLECLEIIGDADGDVLSLDVKNLNE